ncbi:MAG: uroporphyrinogen-III synthase, partial [Bacteroidetes bacterium]|nr:uroporphyrinogen-III synthase [Bacteroidota bacterium]
MQQNSITILSTQHLQPILLTEAAKKNVVIETIPFIETEAIIDQRIKTKITDLAKAANIIVFTSRNAVEAVTSYLQGTIPGWKIFCIGSATKKSASGYFGKNAILATAGSAGNLADVIVNKKEVSSITFFCGNQRRAELPEKLKQNGIEVTEIVVYKTLALTQK